MLDLVASVHQQILDALNRVPVPVFLTPVEAWTIQAIHGSGILAQQRTDTSVLSLRFGGSITATVRDCTFSELAEILA